MGTSPTKFMSLNTHSLPLCPEANSSSFGDLFLLMKLASYHKYSKHAYSNRKRRES